MRKSINVAITEMRHDVFDNRLRGEFSTIGGFDGIVPPMWASMQLSWNEPVPHDCEGLRLRRLRIVYAYRHWAVLGDGDNDIALRDITHCPLCGEPLGEKL